MGSRSSFRNVNAGDFRFVEGGKTYISIGGFDNVKILVKENGSVKAPNFPILPREFMQLFKMVH